MKHLVRILSFSPIIIILSLFCTIPVLALPPLPSSFYGTVKVNGANVPDGTVIQALVGGEVHAEGFTQTYEGNSFFALDVAGDDIGTAALDGGRDGDTIQFKIGGLPADQTAVWHGGMNVRLDLTAASSEPLSTPQATPRAIPTQTAMVIQVASPLPEVVQASQGSAVPAQPSAIATELSEPLHDPTPDVQPAAMDFPLQNDGENGSGSVSTVVVVVIALPIITALGYTFLAFRKKNM